MKQSLLCLFALAVCLNSVGQTSSDFEGNFSDSSQVLNGSEAPMGTTYSVGNALFPCFYDTSFGGYWKDGWAITNIVDSTTGDFTNLYGVITGTGANQSSTYAVGHSNSVIKLKEGAASENIEGLYITNTTYAYKVIRDGNNFTKPGGFGGTSGDDEDFFGVSVKAYKNGQLSTDSVFLYLADYRFEDNSLDYIVNEWTWLDLTSFGPSDSLLFTLITTDTGQFGPNTPFFFAIDDFTTTAEPVGIFENQRTVSFQVFPNPTTDYISFTGNIDFNTVKILNLAGMQIDEIKLVGNTANLKHLNKGVYFIQPEGSAAIKVIKN